jgi:hypothetical protein
MRILMKIYPLEVRLFHTSTRTDRHDEANNHFHYFAKALQTGTIAITCVYTAAAVRKYRNINNYALTHTTRAVIRQAPPLPNPCLLY